MSGAFKDVDPTIIVAAIGIITVIVSGVVARWQAGGAFRREVERYQLERNNQLSEEYLKRAREHADTVYIPLSSEIARLKGSFNSYLFNGKNDEDLVQFNKDINSFTSETQRLYEKGASAFITTELEETILSFVTFLRASKNAVQAEQEVVFNYNVGFWGLPFASVAGSTRAVSKPDAHLIRLTKLIRRSSIRVPGFAIEIRQIETVKAPLNSELFQEKFSRDAHLISVLVKEVMLGVPARASIKNLNFN